MGVTSEGRRSLGMSRSWETEEEPGEAEDHFIVWVLRYRFKVLVEGVDVSLAVKLDEVLDFRGGQGP